VKSWCIERGLSLKQLAEQRRSLQPPDEEKARHTAEKLPFKAPSSQVLAIKPEREEEQGNDQKH